MKTKGKKTDNVKNHRGAKAAAFCKRYWYWFVVLPVLIAGVFVWCFFMGFFDKKETIVSSTDEIKLFVGFRYVLNASATSPVTYEEDDAFREFFTLDGNVLTGQKDGGGYVTIRAGKAKKRVYVTVQTVTFAWTVGVGDRIPLSYAQTVADSVRTGGTGTVVSSIERMERIEDSDEGPGYYETKSAGVCYLTYITAEESTICQFIIDIREDLADEDRNIRADAVFLKENALEQLEQDRHLVGTPIEKQMRDFGDLDEQDALRDLRFGSEGNVYFYSSAPDVVRVGQDGAYEALLPGTAYVTIACVDPVSGWEYHSVKFEIAPYETPVYESTGDGDIRYFYVGETVSTTLLDNFFHHDAIKAYRTDYAAYVTLNAEGTAFTCTRATSDGKNVSIDGIDANGKKIVRYLFTIDEQEEGGGHEHHEHDEE